MNKQTTDTVLMIQPSAFGYNAETAVNNHFQHENDLPAEEIQRRALEEFNRMTDMLMNNHIYVATYADRPVIATPDSIFPNNCVSFHGKDGIVFYSMFSPNRQLERRKLQFILENVKLKYFKMRRCKSLSNGELMGRYLEGTGSMVLDRVNKIAYAALSERTNEMMLKTFCEMMGYTALSFHANQTVGEKRVPIYHTNVMMSVAEDYAVICLDSVDDPEEKKAIVASLEKTKKEIIEITEKQVGSFAGNMLQLHSKEGKRFMVMSQTAHDSLRDDQLDAIRKYNDLIVPAVPTIEKYGGGSVRCMMCELF